MKLKPYIKNGNRMATERSKIPLASNATKLEKEERMNANRAIKKAYRQELKRETDKIVEDMMNKKGDADE